MTDLAKQLKRIATRNDFQMTCHFPENNFKKLSTYIVSDKIDENMMQKIDG